MMIQKCPQCGADLPFDESCRHRFDRCLAFEYENPGTFGAVHHLTVVCYMLQHNAYTRPVWLAARQMVAQFVRDGLTPAEMRQQIRAQLANGQRNWRVTTGEKLAEFVTIRWTRTIADVRLDDPERYCADVTRWAESVLADTEPLLQKLEVEEAGT